MSATSDFIEGRSEVIPVINERRQRPELTLVLGGASIETPVTPEVTEADVADMEDRMAQAGTAFLSTVAHTVARTPHDRSTHLTYTSMDPEAFRLADGWQPKTVTVYDSDDAFQTANPASTVAATELIHETMRQADRLQYSTDPTVAYASNQRSQGGRKKTRLTQTLCNIDPGIARWIDGLPQAPELRPVAHPWSDTTVVLARKNDDGSFDRIDIPMTAPLQALVGGAGDGRGVREREAWERRTLQEFNNLDDLVRRDKRLIITSIGTGTGEPIMDSAMHAMQSRFSAEGYPLEVNGFDIKPASLAVAAMLARAKAQTFNGSLTFNGYGDIRNDNILMKHGIQKAVASLGAHVIEAMGFAEYVASDYAPTDNERQLREAMKKLGCLSAEDFYAAIYESMQPGSILLTGNMRDDSRQANFVTHGLGWPGIIQRSNEDYMNILYRSGIPGSAVDLYIPHPTKSSAIYNLIAVTKR